MGETTNPSPSDRRTTTIQITNGIWAALDRRKSRGDSFDDVIRRLIEATGVGVGALEGPHPDIEFQELEPIPDDDEPDAGCSHYDIIDGEECGESVEYRQAYRFTDGGEYRHFYYCEEHAPKAGDAA